MKPIRKGVPRPTFERRPPIFNPGNNFVFFNAKSDSRKSWQVNLGGNRWRDAVGGSGSYQSVGLTVQPTDRVRASVSASYSEGTDDSSTRTPMAIPSLTTCTARSTAASST